MHKNKIIIDHKDIYLPLLTDTLPYEVPFSFTNFHLHSTLTKHEKDLPESLIRWLIPSNSEKVTIPYNYGIRYSTGKIRTLSIVHPRSQILLCKFYETNSALILEGCSKSRFSIRKPVNVAKTFYEKYLSKAGVIQIQEKLVESEKPPFGLQDSQASSYFAYEKYQLLHRFFDSWEFINLEKKFELMQSLDIAKFFYNIYTHTISWAIKSKSFVKENLNKSSFENDFDKLICKLNYNETNGIVVGPEFSRIFAELILQDIDQKVEQALFRNSKVFGKDYVVRRYVDDYFVFANDRDLLNEIQNLIRDELGKIKLYLNEKKTQISERPFIAPQAISKLDASKLLKDYFTSIFNSETGELTTGVNISRATQNLIKNLSGVAKIDPFGYQSICRYCITFIINKSFDIIKKVYTEDDDSPLSDNCTRSYIRYNLQLLFYLYAMDCNVRTTYLLGRYIIILTRVLEAAEPIAQAEAKQKIYELATQHLENEAEKIDFGRLEAINLLIVLRNLGDKYLISPKLFQKVFRLKKKEKDGDDFVLENIDYFEILTAIYYAQSNHRYQAEMDAVRFSILEYFKSDNTNLNKADDLMLLLDLSSCPWIDKEIQVTILKESLKTEKYVGKSAIKAEAEKLRKFLKRRTWFFDWDSGSHLGTLLEKKELSTPY